MSFKTVPFTLFLILCLRQSYGQLINNKLDSLEKLVQAIEDSRATRNDVIDDIVLSRQSIQSFIDDTCSNYTSVIGNTRSDSLERVADAKAKADAAGVDVTECLKDEAVIIDATDLALTNLSEFCFNSTYAVADVIVFIGINTAHYYTRFYGLADHVMDCTDVDCVSNVNTDIVTKLEQSETVLRHQQDYYENLQQTLFENFKLNVQVVETDVVLAGRTADQIVECIEKAI